MIDFDKFNPQVDFNNLDANDLSRILSEHRNTFIKAVLIVGSFFVLGMIFNDHRAKDHDLRAKISQMQDKLAAMNSSDAAAMDLNKFKSSLPKKINESDLISLISEYAKPYNINIDTLSPAESKDMGLYDSIDVNFSSTSDNFTDMMLFLRKIEKSDLPLMINSWSGQEGLDGKITFTLVISAVIIHT